MSSGAGGSRRSSNAASRPSDLAGPSSYRFAERRQERMRGAGTAVAMQRDFQFKLPPKRPAPLPAATTSTSADASTSTDTPGTQHKRGRPRGLGLRQRESVAAAAAAEVAERSLDESADPVSFSPLPAGGARLDTSSSFGVARRVARPRLSGPVSSTPAASRIWKEPRQPILPPQKPSSSAQRSYPAEDDEDLDSQLGDAEDYSGADGSAGAIDASPGWDAGLAHVDESLPMIPSPAASSSHVDSSVRRMRPSVGGASVSRLSIADKGDGDSPATRAAQRNLDARKRRRQASPGVERQQRQPTAKRRGRSQKSTSAQARSRALIQEPSEYDETVMDRTLAERQRGAPTPASARPRKEMQRRLKRALTLVFSGPNATEDADDSATRPAKKRKSAKYLNDVDIVWSVVDEELRGAIEEQPAKAPFLALKALRKSIRSNFLNLSEKTDTRTTLISQLLRARKQKRQLRKEVFAKRSQLAKLTVEARERQKEMADWSNEVKHVRRVNAFLLNLKHQAAAWN